MISTRGNTDNKYIAYFKHPLYGISASSSYGLPNSLAHFPVVFMISYFGILICGQSAKPLLPVYFIIALYVARDMVIMSYKNFSIPLGIWAIFILFLVYKADISNFLTSHSRQFAIYATIAISCLFISYIILFVQYVLKWRRG